jgi:hypothetical protein
VNREKAWRMAHGASSTVRREWRETRRPFILENRILNWFIGQILPTTTKLASIYQKQKFMQE